MEDKILILKGMIEKAYRIEAGFENEAYFHGFIEVLDDEQKRVLLKLIMDSEKHKITLEKLAKILGFELSKPEEIKFSYDDNRVFNEIYELEITAKILYEQISERFADILGENVEIFKELAREEEMHAKLVEKYVDRTLRIV